MRKNYMRIFAVIIAVVMAFAFLPTFALAEEQPLYSSDSDFYYGRRALGNLKNYGDLVGAYDAIGQAIKNGESEVSLKNYKIPSSKEMAYLLVDTYNKDHPEYYSLSKVYAYDGFVDKGKIYISTIYLNYYTGYDRYAFNIMANRFLDAVKDMDTEYEKALALYDMLQTYIEYAYDSLDPQITSSEDMMAYSAYGAIVNGKAVCEGYAEAYQYLLQRLGIECYIVTGDSINGGAHEWNLIKIDGNYYHIDLTWDDADVLGKLWHNYFNITTQRILEGHIIDDPYGMLAECTATDATYKYENVITTLDVNKIAKLFKGDRKKTANFYYTGERDTFVAWWQSNYSAVFNRISGLERVSYSISYMIVGKEYVLSVTPSDYGATIGGTLLSWGDSGESTKIELFKQGEDTPYYTELLEGNFNFWMMEDVKNGNYKLRVSKQAHKTVEYDVTVSGDDVEIKCSLSLIADVNGDGAVDIRDLVRAKLNLVNNVENEACDADDSGSFDALDLIKIIETIRSA